MSFNLITSPWLEVRRASGITETIRPGDMTDHLADDPILALNFPRPDWNAAVTEFLIGLTTLALAPEDADEWAERFASPPAPQELQKSFEKFAPYFDFDGDGPRAFQDFDPLDSRKSSPVSFLLIDAPGENTIKLNKDLFIKRNSVRYLNLPYAAATLITLQNYAPKGGSGHRTSLRGGGPLTTLIAPRRKGKPNTTFWDRIWANVSERDEKAINPEVVLPWLAPTRTSEHNQMVTEADTHPYLAYFACPRRIRLDFSNDVTCDMKGLSSRGVTGHRRQNYGANYLHWKHPLSPYRNDKEEGMLPLHPHAGLSDYGDWIAWWGGDGEEAAISRLWEQRQEKVNDLLDPIQSMEVFGFNMDDMKAYQWLNTAIPWLPFSEQSGRALQGEVRKFIEASDKAAKAVTFNAKLALYGIKSDDAYRLPENLGMEALKESGERLWRETEQDFRKVLYTLQSLLKDGEANAMYIRKQWLETLACRAKKIFDETVDIDGLTGVSPKRLIWSRHRLLFEFSSHPKAGVTKILGLASEAISAKSKKERKVA